MGKHRQKTRGGTNGAIRPNCAKEPHIKDWDQYFHNIARAVAQKSKDPNCRVGAVIVSEDQLVVSTGFNGLARGVFDAEDLLRNVNEKLKWICHAELNAISNVARIGVPVKGGTIFVTKFPCFECCNAIAQAGLKRIYTLDNRYWDDDEFDGIECKDPHSRKRALLKQAGIRVDAPFHPDFNSRWDFPRATAGPTTYRTNGAGPAPAQAEFDFRDELRKPPAMAQARRKAKARSRAS
jgi:dCMP deaminase